MTETEVLLKTHKFLKSARLWDYSVVRLFTDAHATLLDQKELKPFQRFTLNMDEFVLHPDLVGQLGDGETVFAIEGKGETDLLKGIAQAEMYQDGFHCSFIAADANALGTRLVELARNKEIGVIAVADEVRLVELPKVRMPLREKFHLIARQLESIIQIGNQNVFQYNIPTHYLVWVIALEANREYRMKDLHDHLGDYPMPKDMRSALKSAAKLGLVIISGRTVRLSPIGEATKTILQADLKDWTEVHRTVGARGSGIPLVQVRPNAAAILKILLLQDPLVQLMIEGLRSTPDQTATFAGLATICDKLDPVRARVFFLKPESVERLMNDRGRIDWNLAEGRDYRSTTFYQYKSILKHAGILSWTKLGGASALSYDPHRDIWELF
jgi:hypothetical protein